jgi:hypothetical protein
MNSTGQYDPVQVRAVYRQRRLFLTNWNDVRLQLGLGPEHRLVATLVDRALLSAPWSWTQIGTQKQWAALWDIPERTFKRHLSTLTSSGVLIGSVEKATSGVRSPKLKDTYEFPVYRLHPLLVEFVLRQHQLGCPRLSEVVRALENYAESRCQNGPVGGADKCQNGTYRALATPPEVPIQQMATELPEVPETPASAGDSDSEGAALEDKKLTHQPSPIDITISTESVTAKHSDRVRRRLRRRTSNREDQMARRGVPEDDDPTPIGADPEWSSRTSRETRSPAPSKFLLDAFRTSWQAARRDERLPPDPFPTRNSKIAFQAWVNRTFLPSLDGDVEQAVAIIELFCEQVAAGASGWAYQPNPERGVWDLWKHLSPRAESTRQLLIERGWKSEAERELESQIAQRREHHAQEARKRALDARRDKEAWLASQEGVPVLIPFGPDGEAIWPPYRWLADEQTADHRDWVDVPWDDGNLYFGLPTYEEAMRRGKGSPKV